MCKDLFKIENYDVKAYNCYAFSSSKTVKNGISLRVGNMVGGFPFEVNGIPFYTSGSAYICGAFSNDTPEHKAIQKELADCKNGFVAKKFIRKPHEREKRDDWEKYNVEWMKYVVWCKCNNPEFARLLLSIPAGCDIVEDSTSQRSTTASFWGVVNGVGSNVMGKILMNCRDCLMAVRSPEIDFNLLNEKNIWILGKKLIF